MPYKKWLPGETLFAADVQTYSMDQAVMVFASAAARDSALAGKLQDGMVAYIGDGRVTIYNGSSWVDWL